MREPGRVARAFRISVGLVYLLGAPTHVYFALANRKGYRDMSEWAPPISELSRLFWETWFLPNARLLGLGIALIELTVAALIFSRGMATRLGFLGALKFHGLLSALFGMWPYTIPMMVALAFMVTFHFERGPVDVLVRRLSVDHGRMYMHTTTLPNETS